MKTYFCSQCGSPVGEHEKFCAECGSINEQYTEAVEAEGEAQVEVEPHVEAEPEVELQAQVEPAPAPEPEPEPEAEPEPVPVPAPEPTLEPVAEPEVPVEPEPTADLLDNQQTQYLPVEEPTTYISSDPSLTAAQPPVEPLQQAYVPTYDETATQTPLPPKKKMSGGKIALIVVAVVLGVGLSVGGGILAAHFLNKDKAPEEPTVEVETKSTEKKKKVEKFDTVELTKAARSSYAEKNNLDAYPIYELSYPETWSLKADDVDVAGEEIVIENGDGLEVIFDLNAVGENIAWPKKFEKLTTAKFQPGKIVNEEMPDLGTMVVGKAYSDELGKYLYALIPEQDLSGDHQGGLEVSSYFGEFPPSFNAIQKVAVYATSTNELPEQSEKEVAAIIASFKIRDYYKAKNQNGTPDEHDVLPQSAVRLLDYSDLQNLDDRELFFARNEIYARHGRLFKNQELQAYFDQQPWYQKLNKVAPENFDESVLSDIERKNAVFIRSVEESRQSPYLKQ